MIQGSFRQNSFKVTRVKYILRAGKLCSGSVSLITVYWSQADFRDSVRHYDVWSVIHTQIIVFRQESQTFGQQALKDS